ncbi:MAG: DUF1450 domain-containing protein [Porticoccaceae bacterium]
MKIRFCEHSPRGKSRLVKRLAQEFPDLDVKVKGCCKQCKACRETAFCLVDNQSVLTAKDWDDLYKTICKNMSI